MKMLKILNWRWVVSFSLGFLLLFYAASCSYMKVKYLNSNELASLTALGKVHKNFILNKGGYRYQLQTPTVEETQLRGIVSPGFDVPVHYYDGRPDRYLKSAEASMFQEVHIYLNDDYIPFQPGEVVIPFENIKEIRVIDHDTGKTVLSYIFTPIGYGTAWIIAISIIAAASSCPYVYAYNGESYIFEGETYSGAIFRGLERDDYMPLPDLVQEDGIYRLRISDELKEHQYTNLANLVAVSHPKGTKVLPDKYGRPQLIAQEQPPMLAISENGKDMLAQVLATDQDVFPFNEETATNQLYLSFNRPRLAKTGKLVLNVRNSLWGDMVYAEFSKKFGSAYMPWIAQQNQLTKEDFQARPYRQDFKLVVAVKTANGWATVDDFEPIGPLGNRDIVLPIALNDCASDKVEVRLTSSFMFWEIDRAAMDFTPNTQLDILELKPSEAFGPNTHDARAALANDDDQYLEQMVVGDFTEIHFEAVPIQAGMEQTIYLHSKGYYNHIRDYKGLPDRKELEKFKTPGYFDQFSKDLFKERMANKGNELAKLQ
ncbi:MAG: hypothetical protein IT258_18385 [Saprospiraceae bacterium]|nr:hypothetical protein [Saprospiraceae bacterium]